MLAMNDFNNAKVAVAGICYSNPVISAQSCNSSRCIPIECVET